MRSTGPLMLFTSFAKTQNLRPASLASERGVGQIKRTTKGQFNISEVQSNV